MIGNEPRIEEKPNQKASLKGHKNQKISLSSKKKAFRSFFMEQKYMYNAIYLIPA